MERARRLAFCAVRYQPHPYYIPLPASPIPKTALGFLTHLTVFFFFLH